jgi:hypothetical protein
MRQHIWWNSLRRRCSSACMMRTAMRYRFPVLPAPGPLAAYAQALDVLLPTRTQRAGFRRSLAGLLFPTEHHTTLTGLAHTEPVVGA